MMTADDSKELRPETRAAQVAKGLARVERFDAPLVARLFVDAVCGITAKSA